MKRSSIFYIFFIVIILGVVGYWFLIRDADGRDEIVKELTTLEKLDVEIKAGDWDVFYPINDWLDNSDEEIDLNFLNHRFTYNDNNDFILYKRAYIQPVIREVYEKEDILYFDGWIQNAKDKKWFLITFVLMGNFQEVSHFNEPVNMQMKYINYKENDVDYYEEINFIEIKERLIIGDQISITYYHSFPEVIDASITCNGLEDPQCTGLFLSENYNKIEIINNLPFFQNNDSIVYVDLISFDLFSYE